MDDCCYECTGYGDDYYYDEETHDLVCACAETVCPHPSGVACWEQYLLHKDKREERDD